MQTERIRDAMQTEVGVDTLANQAGEAERGGFRQVGRLCRHLHRRRGLSGGRRRR